MSSGEFVGIVADNPDQKIKLKVFHSEIQNDHSTIKREEENFKSIPIIKQVSEADIHENYLQIKSDIDRIFKVELNKIGRVNQQKNEDDDLSSDGASISM